MFSSLEADEIDEVLKRSKELSFEENEVIFQQGDSSGVLYIVLSGGVQISTMVMEDLEKPLVALRTGDLFGEISLIDQNPREAKAIAFEATKALALDGPGFDDLIKDSPKLGVKILKLLTQTVVNRIRLTTDLYKSNIQWGLEVSGALELDWHRLITDELDVRLQLRSGNELQGKFLKVDSNKVGIDLFLKTDDDKIKIIPYHSIELISFNRVDPMSLKAVKELPDGLH